MAIVYAQNIVEIAVIATLAGRPHVNVLHVHNDEAAKTDQVMVKDFANNWQDHLMSLVSTEYVLQSFDWRSLDPDDTNVGSLLPDPSKPAIGQIAGDVETPNTSYLIHKKTANRPRGRSDGRMYLGGVPSVNTFGNGTLTTTWQATMNAKLQLFVDGVSDDAFGVGGGSGLAVLETTPASRTPGTVPVTLTWRAVTAMVTDTRVGSQRDRLR